jgi:hypothetical protein
LHRRIRTEPGPVGHRQAILAYISLLFGAEKPVVLKPEETLAFPFLPILAALAALVALVAPFATPQTGFERPATWRR